MKINTLIIMVLNILETCLELEYTLWKFRLEKIGLKT